VYELLFILTLIIWQCCCEIIWPCIDSHQWKHKTNKAIIYYIYVYITVYFNGVHLSHSRQVGHVYYQLFDFKMADGDQLWSVPKLDYDLLRRNASTNGRKTDMIERYILHRKPKHTIYIRYFSILLYLLNVQIAPTENKTSLKLWWRISLKVLSWQDSETRPGEFVIFMLSIIIEKEDYKTRWDSYPGIG
jgi:hypothetical protein